MPWAMVADLPGQLRAAIAHHGAPSSDFDLNKGTSPPSSRALTPAAVLVGIRIENGAVVLTKRSPRLKHHPGQIAFAGGKQDPTDVSPTHAALREASEEIGLPGKLVDVIGMLPAHETVTGFNVHPVVALIRGKFVPILEPGEVSEVFEVPLSYLKCPENYRIESRFWRGQRRHFYVVPYGPYYIWGATARILRALADRLAP